MSNYVPQNNAMSRLNNQWLEKYDLEEKKMCISMYIHRFVSKLQLL